MVSSVFLRDLFSLKVECGKATAVCTAVVLLYKVAKLEVFGVLGASNLLLVCLLCC